MKASSARVAIVLAGGRATRMGADKVRLDIAGRPLLDRVLTACAGWQIVVVGPPDLVVPDGVTLVREDPPFAGPVAAIKAGLRHVTEPALVALLAADQPFLDERALTELADAARTSAAAVYQDGDGQLQYLCAVWRFAALHRALTSAGASMRSLYAHADIRVIEDRRGAAADVDTPADLARARELLSQTRPRSTDPADPHTAGRPEGEAQPTRSKPE